jgi:prolyl oligopeptidase
MFYDIWYLFIITEYLQSLLQLHNMSTGALIQKFALDAGSVVGFSGKKQHSEIFYHFMSFLSPGITYHVDLRSPQPYKPTVRYSM